jgi:diguanylate cyclase (GGDEF)-like protein/PAS domain S-box-containing protein
MVLDTPTMFLVLIVASVVLAAAIAFIAFRRQQNLFLWATGLAVQGWAYALLSLRGQISDTVSIVAGNVALSAAFALYGEGIYRFQGRRPPRWLLWSPLAIIGISFCFLLHDLHARVVLGGLIFILQGAVVPVALLQKRRETPGRGQYILAAGAFTVIGLMIARVVSVFSGAAHIPSITASGPIQGATFMASLVAILLLSVGLVMMNQERAEQAAQSGQRFDQFHRHILELLASGESLNNILTATVKGIEHLHPGMLCSVLLLDRQGRHLGEGVAPSLPDFYNAAVHGLEIGLGVGSCGTAAFTKQRVVVDNIATHPYWAPFRAIAAQAGLGACWSQPILSSTHEVLGTFAIYHHEAHTPTQANISLIEQSANLASIAIERSREAAELKQSEERYRLLVEAANEGIGVTQDGVMRFVNRKLRDLIGYSEADILGRPFLDFIHEEDRETARRNHQKRLHGQANDLRYPLRLLTKNQGARWFEMSGALFEWAGQPATLNFLIDITDRKEMEERIRQLAYHDALTMLPNRRLLIDHLHLAMARHKRSARYGALMFMDLDNFKPLNDMHGHDAGDLLLIEVAQRLKASVREIDTVARFGGDEFVVMLSDLDEEAEASRAHALGVAEKIRSTLSAPYRLLVRRSAGGESVVEHHCSASIGVVLFLSQAGEEDELLRRADAAMYQAKQAGRNTIRLAEQP